MKNVCIIIIIIIIDKVDIDLADIMIAKKNE